MSDEVKVPDETAVLTVAAMEAATSDADAESPYESAATETLVAIETPLESSPRRV